MLCSRKSRTELTPGYEFPHKDFDHARTGVNSNRSSRPGGKSPKLLSISAIMSRQRILCIAPLIALCTGVFWSTEAHPSPSGAEMPAAARSTMDVLNACGPNALYVLLKLRNIPGEFDAMRAVA